VEPFKTGKTDYDKLFDGFQSTSDFPGYLLYRNLLDQYPDAKVVLTVRDPEEWYESAIRTVHAYTPQTFQQKWKLLPKRIKSKRFRGIAKTLRLVEVFLWKGYLWCRDINPAQAIGDFGQNWRTNELWVPCPLRSFSPGRPP